jgi:hypothetical protein
MAEQLRNQAAVLDSYGKVKHSFLQCTQESMCCMIAVCTPDCLGRTLVQVQLDEFGGEENKDENDKDDADAGGVGRWGGVGDNKSVSTDSEPFRDQMTRYMHSWSSIIMSRCHPSPRTALLLPDAAVYLRMHLSCARYSVMISRCSAGHLMCAVVASVDSDLPRRGEQGRRDADAAQLARQVCDVLPGRAVARQLHRHRLGPLR